MLDSLWQDAVLRGLLAAAVSLCAQWAAPKARRAIQRLRARRLARRRVRALSAARGRPSPDASGGSG
jgi:hypothetical protein